MFQLHRSEATTLPASPTPASHQDAGSSSWQLTVLGTASPHLPHSQDVGLLTVQRCKLLSAHWRDGLTRTRCASPVGALQLPSSGNLPVKKIQVDNAEQGWRQVTALPSSAQLSQRERCSYRQYLHVQELASFKHTLPKQLFEMPPACTLSKCLLSSPNPALLPTTSRDTVIPLTQMRTKAQRLCFTWHACPPAPHTRARSGTWSFSPGTFAREGFQCKEELTTSQC